MGLDRLLLRLIASFGLGGWLLAASAVGQHATARESFVTTPSSQFVDSFFAEMVKIVFLAPSEANAAARTTDLRALLARSIDAEAIGRFILGRYGKAATSADTAPAEGFLDFATDAAFRMTPQHGRDSGALPVLAILDSRVRKDQIRLVQTELILAGGQHLPLTWEIAENPAGPQVEDVTCLGISLRLMLRSAVAEAAAEHPDDAHDLARLLAASSPLPRLVAPAAQ
jgi:ABC-type transporter MlaC component